MEDHQENREVEEVSAKLEKSLSISAEDKMEKYNRLIADGKNAAKQGDVQKALELFKVAYQIYRTEKIKSRIRKIEELLAQNDSEDEDDEFVNVNNSGLMLYRELHNKLYDYQRDGVAFLYGLYRDGRKGGVLADDMGLGKTIQVISFLSGMYDNKLIKHTLLVMPTSLLKNWIKEFAKWTPSMRVKEFHGMDKAERTRSLERVQRGHGVVITTYTMLARNWQQLSSYKTKEFCWDYMILDEAHKIKNTSTKTAKSAYAIPSKNRILLTGTPVQNNLKEMWTLFDFACQGALLGTAKTFKAEYENPITRAREKDATTREKTLGSRISDNLVTLIKPYFLRRTKSEVQKKKLAGKEEHSGNKDINVKHEPADSGAVMPKLTRKNDLIVWTYMSRIQEDIYRQFIKLDHIEELLLSTRSPLTELSILKKLCDHPRLLAAGPITKLGLEENGAPDSHSENTVSNTNIIANVPDDTLVSESGKLIFLLALLERLREEGHRTLVFAHYRKVLDILHRILGNRGFKVLRLDGTITQITERERLISLFQKDKRYSVFLLTPQVAGVGITLTAANRVVIYDPSWNPATDAQAVDRAYRIGQTENVVVYRLITCGTVEEKIYRRQVFKDSLTRQNTGDKKNPFRYFSRQELRELFTLQDTRSSSTQLQLKAMHSRHRRTDPELDEHIAHLHSMDMFGISDHDLMFSLDLNHDEDLENQEEHHYIEGRVQKAQELMRAESKLQVQLVQKIVPETEPACMRRPPNNNNKNKSNEKKTGRSKQSPVYPQPGNSFHSTPAKVNLDHSGSGEDSQQNLMDHSGSGEDSQQYLMDQSGSGEENHQNPMDQPGSGEDSQQNLMDQSGSGEENHQNPMDQPGSGEENSQNLMDQPGSGEENSQNLMDQPGSGEENQQNLMDQPGSGEEDHQNLSMTSGDNMERLSGSSLSETGLDLIPASENSSRSVLQPSSCSFPPESSRVSPELDSLRGDFHLHLEDTGDGAVEDTEMEEEQQQLLSQLQMDGSFHVNTSLSESLSRRSVGSWRESDGERSMDGSLVLPRRKRAAVIYDSEEEEEDQPNSFQALGASTPKPAAAGSPRQRSRRSLGGNASMVSILRSIMEDMDDQDVPLEAEQLHHGEHNRKDQSDSREEVHPNPMDQSCSGEEVHQNPVDQPGSGEESQQNMSTTSGDNMERLSGSSLSETGLDLVPASENSSLSVLQPSSCSFPAKSSRVSPELDSLRGDFHLHLEDTGDGAVEDAETEEEEQQLLSQLQMDGSFHVNTSLSESLSRRSIGSWRPSDGERSMDGSLVLPRRKRAAGVYDGEEEEEDQPNSSFQALGASTPKPAAAGSPRQRSRRSLGGNASLVSLLRSIMEDRDDQDVPLEAEQLYDGEHNRKDQSNSREEVHQNPMDQPGSGEESQQNMSTTSGDNMERLGGSSLSETGLDLVPASENSSRSVLQPSSRSFPAESSRVSPELDSIRGDFHLHLEDTGDGAVEDTEMEEEQQQLLSQLQMDGSFHVNTSLSESLSRRSVGSWRPSDGERSMDGSLVLPRRKRAAVIYDSEEEEEDPPNSSFQALGASTPKPAGAGSPRQRSRRSLGGNASLVSLLRSIMEDMDDQDVPLEAEQIHEGEHNRQDQSHSREEVHQNLMDQPGSGEESQQNLMDQCGSGEENQQNPMDPSGSGEESQQNLMDQSGSGEVSQQNLMDPSGSGEENQQNLMDRPGSLLQSIMEDQEVPEEGEELHGGDVSEEKRGEKDSTDVGDNSGGDKRRRRRRKPRRRTMKRRRGQRRRTGRRKSFK